MQPLLEVDDLHMHFFTRDGVVKAVDGVSFTLESGRTLGVVGESGSGKSVTAMSIMRLVPEPPGKVVSGDIRIKGESILAMSDKDQRRLRGNRIAMIFQDPMTSLNPVYRIGKQIAEPLVLHKNMSRDKAWAAAVELLKQVGIPQAEQRARDYPHEFSGGMRQRAMIAMALACGPDVLIADEPTTALDVTIQAQILELMQKLQTELNMGVILITHDLGVVAEVCSRVMVMYLGQIVEECPVEILFDNPLHPYTCGLIQSIPSMETNRREPLHVIEGTVPSLFHVPAGCHFAPRCPYADAQCQKPPELLEIDGEHKVRCWHPGVMTVAKRRSA